ncbi:TonB-dependent siderophore receptor [Scytonema sp. NUACC26]|uniref:TonB-dependent siderophore receptor n=1 Tax=Scytonema sp. NUACC26 TaxID=3140176 RepID=UPI0034DB8E3A
MLIKWRYGAINWLIPVLWVTGFNPAFGEQPLPKKQRLHPDDAKSKIQSLSEVQSAKTSANYLLRTPKNQNFAPQLSQATTDVVVVTDVKVNSSDKGIELILVTANSEKLQVSPKTEGNSYIADIKNAKLQLANGESFQQLKPVTGIAEVTVANVDANTLRVTVVGETDAPVVRLFDSQTEGLVFGVTSAASTANQPTQTPQQKPQTQQKQPPIELEVTAPPDTYRAPNTSVGTKTDTPLRDIPATVQVFPRQVIDDLGGNRITDVVQTAGIGSPDFSSRIADSFSIRGFRVDTSLRNGIRDLISGFTIDTANLERIEVLRGPASVLFGQIPPGGVINRVTKQPLSEPYYFAQMRVGTYETYRPSIDISGPLNRERTLLYRLNASYLNAKSFVDFSNEYRYFAAPVLTWQIGKDTKLTLEGEYQDVEQPTYGASLISGLPAEGTVLPNPNGKIPRSRYVGERSTSQSRITNRMGYNFEQRFDNNWVLRNAFQFAQLVISERDTIPSGALQADKRRINRSSVFQDIIRNNYIIDTNVIGQFKTGSIEHKLLFGFDLFWEDLDRQVNFYARSPIDVFNPVYGTPLGRLTSRSRPFTTANAQGVYVQDQISLTDNFKFVLGGRFDWVNNNSRNRISGVKTSQADDAFSPRLGIVYQPSDNVSLYASYSRSFEQVTGTDAQSNPFVPSRGTQYEVGVKTDLLNNKLSATLALFDLTKTNITTLDPNNPVFQIQTGEQRIRGVELFAIGQLAPGWNIIASYNYFDPRITSDNNFPVGNLLNSVPQHSASLWTRYIIPSGAWKGFGGGLGVYYIGDRQGDLANTFTLPSYVRTDAALYYRGNNLRVQLNLQNLFNILYYEAFNRNRVFPSDPFTAQLTVGWEF